MKIRLRNIVSFISHLFRCTWLFFPGIFFVFLSACSFWLLDQGKDLVIAFAENRKAKAAFFIAISFWVYMSWYSARIIAYFKDEQERKKITDLSGANGSKLNDNNAYEIPPSFLAHFPRLIGFACFLVIELAVLQSPLRPHPLSAFCSLILLTLGLVVFAELNYLVSKMKVVQTKWFSWIFTGLFAGFMLLLIVVVQKKSLSADIMSLFWLTLYLHIFFLFLINMRRELVDHKTITLTQSARKPGWITGIIMRLLRVLKIPAGEASYFGSFNMVSAIGLIIYIFIVSNLTWAFNIGPLPTVILAFAILLGFSNLVTAASVKWKLNIHFFILLIVLIIGHKESHYLRTLPPSAGNHSSFSQRQNIYQYFDKWIRAHPEIDSIREGSYYPVYFVLSNGGASRSAYWTSAVLGRLEDTSFQNKERFSKHLFCLSGTSGGGVGVAAFFSLLKNAKQTSTQQPRFETSSKNFLRQDFLTFTLARMLGPDFFRYLFFPAGNMDRAGALEYAFENAHDDSFYPLHFDEPLDSLVTVKNQPYDLPILCINTTRMQDGNPGIVSNITITDSNSPRVTDRIFNDRTDVLSLLPDSLNLRLSTGAILGARFPYISPAGRIDEMIPKRNSGAGSRDSSRAHYFVDGGYFDNSGAGVVQEMIRGILNFVASSHDSIIVQRARKLQLFVLHITNSPVGDPLIKKSSDLQNDLASPILTILGAYNTQTTVNDQRLENLIRDINNDLCAKIHSASYYPINLYKEPGDTAERYTMNWFISDTTLRKMNGRLSSQPELNQLFQIMKAYPY